MVEATSRPMPVSTPAPPDSGHAQAGEGNETWRVGSWEGEGGPGHDTTNGAISLNRYDASSRRMCREGLCQTKTRCLDARKDVLRGRPPAITSITYAYATAWAPSGFGDVTPARSIKLSFVHDVLVGYDFTSSYTEDLTDFDETRVAQIRTGETKQTEVEQLLGPAGGMHAYPLIKRGPERALVYLYTQTRTKPFSVDVYLKKLVVSVDGNGIVTDVDLNTSGEK